MQFRQEDIDFTRIDEHQFEELCFDLMVAYQFHQLRWRRGGSDKGRDIEGLFTIANALTGPYEERWFAECKHHAGGIGVGDISSKIDWAKAERTDHLIIFTTTYLTQPAHEWLDKIRPQVEFLIHVIEDKRIKDLLLPQTALVTKYFQEDTARLVGELLRQWTVHDIVPEPKAVYDITRKVKFDHLDSASMLFLYAMCRRQREGIDQYCEEEQFEGFDPEFMLPYLADRTTHPFPVFSPEEMKARYLRFDPWSFTSGTRVSKKEIELERIVHGYLTFNQQLLEVYLRAKDGRYECRIGVGQITKAIQRQYEVVSRW